MIDEITFAEIVDEVLARSGQTISVPKNKAEVLRSAIRENYITFFSMEEKDGFIYASFNLPNWQFEKLYNSVENYILYGEG